MGDSGPIFGSLPLAALVVADAFHRPPGGAITAIGSSTSCLLSAVAGNRS
ncbi:hypothetical protein C7S13_7236 [Burkholderia cepacia]|nr:hypothetical protein [Burkholderia cepacia]